MSTRSSARNLFPPLDNPKLTIRRRSRTDPTLLNNSKMAAEEPGDLPVPDLRTMEELCQPSLNGQGGPIAPIAIQATNFGLKNDMIQQNVYAAGAYQGNTFTNTKEDLKGITTRSGTAYQAPTIPTTTSSSLTESLILNSEPVVAPIIEPVSSPVSALKPNQRPSIPYPSRLHDQKLFSALKPNQIPSIPYPSRLHDQKFRDKDNDQREIFFQIFKDLNFNISFVDALILMLKFGPSIKRLLTNKDKLCELARTPLNEHCSVVLLKKLPEKLGDPGKFLIPCDFPGMAECLALADLGASINLMPLTVWNKLSLPDLSPTCITLKLADQYSQEVLGFSDVIASGNPTPYYDLIVSTTSLTLTPFENSDFLLEEVDAFLALEDDPTSPEVDQSYELKIYEAKSDKSSIDEHPKVELKDLPPHLEYAFLEGDDKLPVIIVKDLSVEEKTTLITVLKSHKRAIAWKLSDIKDQEKTTFTCPYGTFAYRRMPFGLCNALGTFQRCMMAIFYDMIEKTMEVFIDDFSVFRNSFQACLSHLEKMLKRCEDTNLCLN
nr:reverse transcriptase domain-containing protein [Tanacetum cinerariifolium]